MTITLEGLTLQQHQIADLLWSCESSEDVQRLIENLPPAYRSAAETVYELMIAAVMDQYTEVDDYVKDCIDRCSR